ncbi:MAG TPA: GAF domain-containing protein [Euzebyales bacterium]
MEDSVISRISEAAVTVASGLELADVLQHVVEAAAMLLDARYAALGVIGDDTELETFVHTGFDGDIDAIGHPPEGRGILGLLIRDAQPLRLDDLSSHPASVGFPEGHPPMRTFLGAPIRVRERVYGNLYVTDKRGGGPFTEADEQLALLVAAAAGAAIDNAIMYGATRQRERSLDALREISGEILGGSEGPRVLNLIAERALELTGADQAVICMPRPSTAGAVLEVRAAAGRSASTLRGELVTADTSLSGTVMRSGVAVDADSVPPELGPTDDDEDLVTVGVPLLIRGDTHGALVVAARRLTYDDRRLLQTFANHAGVIVEYMRARAELERLLLIEERERIGRDLHDTVIQRLFATGLELQALVVRHADDDNLVRTLGGTVENLDDIITQIRATVFALHPPALVDDGGTATASGVHDLVAGIVAESSRALGFTPELMLPNDPDTLVRSDIAAHLLVVLREALSNVARHAAATAAAVEVHLGDEVVVRVTDNGLGLPPEASGTGDGLANMRHRAETIGGRFVIDRALEGGTRLEWRVRDG